MDKASYIMGKLPDASVNESGKIHTLCPFHSDNRPSFSIDVNEGVFICGSAACGVRGNFALFYKMMEGITNWKDVYDELKQTSPHYKIDELFDGVKPEIRKKITSSVFPDESCLETLALVDFLINRGLDQNIIDDFGLRYGNSGIVGNVYLNQTIVCPVWDIDGSLQTFQCRSLNPTAYMRWMNPEGSPIQHLLYGGWLISDKSKDLWVVEGASDTWNLHSYGTQAVGLNTKEASSSQLTKLMHLARLYNLRLIVCMDGKAHEASRKINAEFLALGLNSRIVFLDEETDEDPGELSYERFTEIEGILNEE